jgi:hypothetical protein
MRESTLVLLRSIIEAGISRVESLRIYPKTLKGTTTHLLEKSGVDHP